jgi:restriction system protein
MDSLDAAEEVLRVEGQPLRAKELTMLMLERGLWKTSGRTPEQTVNARIAVDIMKRGVNSRFQRVSVGLFALRTWHLPEHHPKGRVLKPSGQNVSQNRSIGGSISPKTQAQLPTMSFTDAAEQVLLHHANKTPMHYKGITEKALDLELIKTRGQTPDQTMYAQILTEIERKTKRGEASRFIKLGKGILGLAHWSDRGLAQQIGQHNIKARNELRKRLYEITPGEFEDLVGALLVKVGFEEVVVTNRSNDGGIDVRGTLVVGGVIRTRMAVQAKRWKHNVQAPTVQQVRGSLGAHDQGLIITTSDFSVGARQEADRSNAVPVALMNGEQFVSQLVENDLGIRRTSYDLIELDETLLP